MFTFFIYLYTFLFRLAALTTLCNSGTTYQDLLSQIDVSNQSNYNRLGIFVSILIARQCFQLQDFVKVVAINSLIKTYGEVQDGISSQQTELGARLTCHLLLMLFQTVEGTYPSMNQQQSSLNGSGIKHRYVGHQLFVYFFSGPENLKKSSPKNSSNEINQFHGFFLDFFHFLKMFKKKSLKLIYSIS